MKKKLKETSLATQPLPPPPPPAVVAPTPQPPTAVIAVVGDTPACEKSEGVNGDGTMTTEETENTASECAVCLFATCVAHSKNMCHTH